MATNPLTSTLAALLETSVSAALALDDDAKASLVPYDGQALLLRVTPVAGAPELALRITCQAHNGGGLSIMAESHHTDNRPNTIVSGSLKGLLATLTSRTEELPADVNIEGDERLLIALQQCFRDLRPDWREPLENFAERFSGNNRSQGLQDVLGQAELAFASLRTAFGDALGTSSSDKNSGNRFWTSDDDLDGFARRLEDLTLNVDRLQARVDQLEGFKEGPNAQ